MRRMSFALTEQQLLDGSKTVTRRLGWAALRVGDELIAVRKCMGIKRGEKQHVLAKIRIVSVRRESLSLIDRRDVAREGFPGMSPAHFVVMFCKAMKCTADEQVTRIEFVKVDL